MKIIITDCDHKDIAQEEQVFHENTVDFTLFQCKSEEDLLAHCKGYPVLINQYAPMTERVLAGLAPELKLIVRYGVGVDNIDISAATKHGVYVCNVPDYGINEVADHALTLMMALVRKVIVMNDYTKTQNWNYAHAVPILRLTESKVGIVGLGRVGKAFAARVHALGCTVLSFDPYIAADEGPHFVQRVSFETLLSEADIISIHCCAENAENLFDSHAFSQMKKTAYLVNTARGKIVNQDALDHALSEGIIAGAALDVWIKEPTPAGSSVFRHPNLLATPHMAWYSEEAALELKRKAAEEAVRYIKGEPLRCPLNEIAK